MALSTEDLISIVDKVPNLTWKGFRHNSFFDRDLSPEQREDMFRSDRNYLKEHCLKEFELACQWLNNCSKIKNINRRHGSYTLKHYVERWARKNGIEDNYVSNGAFIAAAFYMGFKVVPIVNTPNAYFNISQKSPSIQEDRNQ